MAFLTSRKILAEDRDIDALIEMDGNAVRPVGELASAKVKSVPYCCTVGGALRGIEEDRPFCRDMGGR